MSLAIFTDLLFEMHAMALLSDAHSLRLDGGDGKAPGRNPRQDGVIGEENRAGRHWERYNRSMPVFNEKQEELERYETMMGVPRGRLAVTMDVITDAMALVGQHGVYCQSQRWPGKPVMDIQIVMKNLTDAKELIQSVMEELKKKN
jgi:hypothetical protein